MDINSVAVMFSLKRLPMAIATFFPPPAKDPCSFATIRRLWRTSVSLDRDIGRHKPTLRYRKLALAARLRCQMDLRSCVHRQACAPARHVETNVPIQIALNTNDLDGNVRNPSPFPSFRSDLADLTSSKTLNVTMSTQQQARLSTIERIERALVLLAYFIELDGDVHVAMYEKFEAELGELKRKEHTKVRARKLLLSYANTGGLKAIC
jgi:hypothetical protein